ncbi:MAG: CidA/LrgA family protein [Peptococcaceae bacterium]|jgi:holin-like protein|nr:CidA/LrgA family protein [Peptococcaceae bacterium]
MNICMQIALLFFICLLGQAISLVLPFPFPGNIIAMIILFILLSMKVIKPEKIQDFTGFLLANMAFFFVPAGVSILESYPIMKDSLLPIFLVCLFSTIITFFVTFATVKLVVAWQAKHSTTLKGEKRP